MADYTDPWAEDDHFASPPKAAVAVKQPSPVVSQRKGTVAAPANPFSDDHSGSGNPFGDEEDHTNPFDAPAENPFETHTAAATPAPASSTAVSSPAPEGQAERTGYLDVHEPNGDHYEGNFESNRYHGQGKLTVKGKGISVGLFAAGLFVSGTFTDVNGFAYSGTFKNGVLTGKGKLASPLGVFEGEFTGGKLKGAGICKQKDGCVYTGDFAEGQYNGMGTLDFAQNANEEQYVGSFRNGKMHGQGKLKYGKGDRDFKEGLFENGLMADGVLNFRSGATYTGQFYNDQRQGHGRQEETNGEVYDGTWSDGLKSGGGSLTYAKDSPFVKFDGKFAKDKPADGILRFRNTDCFEGTFNGDGMQKGTLKYANGGQYVGCLNAKGERHGEGVFTSVNNRVQTGTWVNNLPTKVSMRLMNGDTHTGESVWNEESQFFEMHGQGTMNYTCGDTFIGTFDKDCIKLGEMKYTDGSSFKGEFDKQGLRQGKECTFSFADGRKFAGEFEGDSTVKGTMTMKNGEVYTGKFNSDSLPHDEQGKYEKKLEWSFVGQHTNGVVGTGELKYVEGGKASQVDPLAAAKGLLPSKGTARVKYVGTCSELYTPEGEGELTWKNGDVYTGKCQKSMPHDKEGQVKFSSGSTAVGTFVAGEMTKVCLTYDKSDDALVAKYEGDLKAGVRDGKGTVTFRDGATFVGESVDAVLKQGVLNKANGLKFEGALNCENGRKYGEGVLTLKDGTVYKHLQTEKGSFSYECANIATQASFDTKGCQSVAVAECERLNLWPNMPPVAMDTRIPVDISQPYVAVQAKGGANKLTELQTTSSALIQDLLDIHTANSLALAEEAGEDAERKARFGDRWTMDASDNLTTEFHSKLTHCSSLLDTAQAADTECQEKRTQIDHLLVHLVEAVEEKESTIRKAEESHADRQAVLTLLQTQKEVIIKRDALLIDLQSKVGELDILVTLIDGDGSLSVDAARQKELAKVAALREEFSSTVAEHLALVQSITAAHTAYSQRLPEVKVTELKRVTTQMTTAVDAWTTLYQALNKGCSGSTAFKQNDFGVLRDTITSFCASRKTERKQLSTDLLIQDLHFAVDSKDEATVTKLIKADAFHDKIDIDHVSAATGSNCLLLAVRNGDAAMVKVLAGLRANVHVRDKDGNTLPRMALQLKHYDCVPVLKEAGCDLDRAEDEKTQETLLHLYGRENDTEALGVLVKNGASVNARARDGKSALLSACAAQAQDAIHLLCNAGSSPNACDSNGNMPLHFVEKGPLTIFLVQHGSRIKSQNNNKKKAVPDADLAGLKDATKHFEKLAPCTSDTRPIDEKSPLWKPDASSEICLACFQPFSLFNRRHHCRRCGLLVCSNCSTKKVADPGAPKDKFRACDGCFNKCNQ